MGIRGLQAKADRTIRRVALVYVTASDDYPFSFMPEHFQKRPGLGLRYLAAALKAQGIAVDLFDCLFDSRRTHDLPRELNDGRYDLVGFSATHASAGQVQGVVAGLDRSLYAGRIIAGGPCSSQPEVLLDAGVDVVVVGEADQSLLALLRAYEAGAGFEAVKGIAFTDETGARIATAAPPPTPVDLLPIPDWSQYDPLSGDLFEVSMKRPYYVVMASRGCPYHCAYCVTWRYWNRKYRVRPVERVLDEVQFLVQTRGARYIRFLDDVFALRLDWLQAFCEGVERRGLRFSWGITLHPLTFGSGRRKAFEMLQKSGCQMVNYGAQSADPAVLKTIGRSPDEPDALREAIPMANAMGFATVLTYIFGLPGDTLQTLRGNVDFVTAVRPTLVDFHPLDYLPGSDLVDCIPVEARCALPQSEIQGLCRKAFLEYYGLRGGALRTAMYILRHNPEWLAYAGRSAGDVARLVLRIALSGVRPS